MDGRWIGWMDGEWANELDWVGLGWVERICAFHQHLRWSIGSFTPGAIASFHLVFIHFLLLVLVASFLARLLLPSRLLVFVFYFFLLPSLLPSFLPQPVQSSLDSSNRQTEPIDSNRLKRPLIQSVSMNDGRGRCTPITQAS